MSVTDSRSAAASTEPPTVPPGPRSRAETGRRPRLSGSGVKKWAPWLVVVVAAAIALGFGLQSRHSKPTLDAQVQHIASLVRCPVCNGESAAQSQAADATAIRTEIRTELQAGKDQTQIVDGLVRSYGSWILEKPPASGVGAVVWVVPVVGGVAGIAIVVLLLRRWNRRGEAEDDPDARPGPVLDSAASTGGEDGSDSAESSGGGRVPDPAESAVEDQVSDSAEATAGELVAREATAVTEGTVEAKGSRPDSRRRRSRIAVLVAGVALIAGGASWAVVASSGTRLPGEQITGETLSSEQIDTYLTQANTDENAGNTLKAIQDYQKVLDADPTQVEALSGQGWLYVGTGEPSLLQQGLTELAHAEKVEPTYAPAHLYRGLALLGEANYAPAVPELQWYLAHHPDPSVVTEVKNALAQAKSGAAAASKDKGKTAPTAPPTTAKS